MVSHLSPVFSLLFYFVGASLSGSTSEAKLRAVRSIVALALLLHLYSLFIFYPIASSHLLAFLMSVSSVILAFYFVISGGGKFKSYRQIVLGLVISLYLVSSYLLHLGHPQNLQVKSAYLLWSHVGISLVGILCLLISGILGIAYLSQARGLHRSTGGGRSLSLIIGRLPPLRVLSKLIQQIGKLGLFGEIIGIYLGFLYTESVGVRMDLLDPKLSLPMTLVFYYGLVLISRASVSETIFAKLSASGIILSVSSLIIASTR